jgi:hypothetical protein
MGRRKGGVVGRQEQKMGATLSPQAEMGRGSWAAKAFSPS